MMTIFLSEQAEIKLFELTIYLLEKWNKKVKDNFISNLLKKLIKSQFIPKVVFNQKNLKEFINVLYQNKHHFIIEFLEIKMKLRL